jgi:hypothetical protein
MTVAAATFTARSEPRILTAYSALHRHLPAHLLPQPPYCTSHQHRPNHPDPVHPSFPSSHCPPLVPSKSNTRELCAKARLGLADGVTEQAPGSAVGSLALAGTSPSPSADDADHRSTVRRPNGQLGSRDRPGSLSGMPSVSRSPCPRTRSRPRVRCPVSGVRCDRPVSAYAMSTRRLSNVRVWMSGVPRRCPRVLRPRPAVSAPVSSWSSSVRRGSHMVRRGVWIWPSCRIRERLDHLPEPAWLRVRDCLASHRTGSSGWRRRLRSVVTV